MRSQEAAGGRRRPQARDLRYVHRAVGASGYRGRITIRFRQPLLPSWIVVAAGIAATGSLLYAIVWIVFAAF
jgi:hypothetical protein